MLLADRCLLMCRALLVARQAYLLCDGVVLAAGYGRSHSVLPPCKVTQQHAVPELICSYAVGSACTCRNAVLCRL